MNTIAAYIACQENVESSEVSLRAVVLDQVSQVGELTHMLGPNLWQIAVVFAYTSGAEMPLYLCLVHQGNVAPPDQWKPYRALAEYPDQSIQIELSADGVEVGATMGYIGELPEIGYIVPAGWLPTAPPTDIGDGIITAPMQALPGCWQVVRHVAYSSVDSASPYRQIHIAHCELVPSLVS